MKRSQRGLSVVELLVASFVIALTLIAACNLSIGVGRASGSYELTNKVSRNTRITIEETLYQLRGAESLQATATVGNTILSVNGTTTILRLPAYNPANSAFFLDNTWDTVVLQYNATDKVIRETIQPASGSARPSRTNQIIARNVTVASFTYYARQNFRSTITGNQTFALGAPITTSNVVTTGTGGNTTSAVTGVQVFINGSPATFTYVAGGNSITVNSPIKGANIQVIYPVSPNVDGGASLIYISFVDFAMTMRDPDRPNDPISLRGQSLLRNQRT